MASDEGFGLMPNIPAYNRQCVARHLRLGRQTRGFPIERIARSLGWPVSVIEQIEAGEALPTSAELQRMCRWYGLNVRTVFWPPRLRLVSSTTIGAANGT